MTAISFVKVFQLYRLFKQKPCIDAGPMLQNNLRAKEIISMLKNDNQGLKTYLCKYFRGNDIPIIDALFDCAKNMYYNDLAAITTAQIMRNGAAEIYASIFWTTSGLIIHTFKFLNLKSLNTCSCV